MTVIDQRIIERPGRPRLIQPEGIVVHAMGQMVAGQPAWEFLRDLGVDAHRLIYPDGTIQQIIPDHLMAWHAGASRLADIEKMNRTSLGVELLVAGDHREPQFTRVLRNPKTSPYQEAQLVALVACLTEWTTAFPSIDWILGHEHISGPWVRDDPKSDPGPWIEWPKLWRDVWGMMPNQRPR